MTRITHKTPSPYLMLPPNMRTALQPSAPKSQSEYAAAFKAQAKLDIARHQARWNLGNPGGTPNGGNIINKIGQKNYEITKRLVAVFLTDNPRSCRGVIIQGVQHIGVHLLKSHLQRMMLEELLTRDNDNRYSNAEAGD